MGNSDNHCSDLEVKDNKSNDFDFIFNMQKILQENNYNYDFSKMTLHDIAQFYFMNKHAIEDEMSEMFDALGGIKDGIGNAVWKPWKTANVKAKFMTINDLSENDLKELKMEIVDMFHFFMNFGIVIGMTGSELYNMYIAKNKENWDRQKRGY